MQRALMAIVLAAVVTGCRAPSDAPFQQLELDQDCRICFLRGDGEPSAFNLRNGSFCLRDKRQLNLLKRGWIFTNEHEPTSCGFEYSVYVLQNHTPIAHLSLNGPCGYVVTDNGWYEFDTLYYEVIDRSTMEHLDARTADSLGMALNALFGP